MSRNFARNFVQKIELEDVVTCLLRVVNQVCSVRQIRKDDKGINSEMGKSERTFCEPKIPRMKYPPQKL